MSASADAGMGSGGPATAVVGAVAGPVVVDTVVSSGREGSGAPVSEPGPTGAGVVAAAVVGVVAAGAVASGVLVGSGGVPSSEPVHADATTTKARAIRAGRLLRAIAAPYRRLPRAGSSRLPPAGNG